MPADAPHVGTGKRRQTRTTEPDRTDDSRKALDRQIAEEVTTDDQLRRRESGAHSPAGPHQIIPPGTRRDIEEADLGDQAG